MRQFKCNKCLSVGTLYAWNTAGKTFRDITLHEIKDDEDFAHLRFWVLFTCPACAQKSTADEVEEVQ